MSVRRVAFVREYVRCGNATQAATIAGFKDPSMAGWKLLQADEVKAAIERAQERIQDAAIADAVERRRFWSTVFRDGQYEMRDRLKASELLGKACGDFIERRELTNPDGSLSAPAIINVIGIAARRDQDT